VGAIVGIQAHEPLEILVVEGGEPVTAELRKVFAHHFS